MGISRRQTRDTPRVILQSSRSSSGEMCGRPTAPLPDDYFQRIGGEHEQVVETIEHVRAGTPAVYSVNVPNRGIVANLPEEVVIECPAVTTPGGLRPLAQPPVPAPLAGTLATRFQWAETTVEAALEGSRDKFVAALMLGRLRDEP